jgi:hypothetical protein
MPVITRRRAKSLEAKKGLKKSVKRFKNTLKKVNPYNVPLRDSLSKSLTQSLKKNKELYSNLDNSFKSIRRLSLKKLGQGAFGLVQRPPQQCSNKNDNKVLLKHYASKEYVSKLTESEKAEQELNIANIIRDKIHDWYDYYCLVEYVCDASAPITSGQDELDTLAIMPYCGISLENLISKSPKITIDAHGYWFILYRLKQLIRGINKMNFNNIFHLDIHPGNIAFNWPENRREIKSYSALKLLLIDFGLSVHLPDLASDNTTLLSSEFADLEGLILLVLLPTMEFIVESKMFLTSKEEQLMDLHDDIKSYIADVKHKMKVPKRALTNKEYSDYLDICYGLLQKYNTIIPDYKKSK